MCLFRKLFPFPTFHCASLESCFHFPSFTLSFWKSVSLSHLSLGLFGNRYVSHLSLCLFGKLFPFPIFHCVSFRKSTFASSHQYFPFPIFDCCLFGNLFDEGVTNHFLQQYCKYRHQFIVSLSAVLELFQPPLMIMIHSMAADATTEDLQQPNSSVEKFRYASTDTLKRKYCAW